MKRIAIWLDDLRNPENHAYSMLLDIYAPNASVLWVKTVSEFKEAVTRVIGNQDQQLIALFFDNDLGTKLEGCDAFNWFEALVYSDNIKRVGLYAQTQNTSAKLRLEQGFAALERHWYDVED